ncbi:MULTISPECIES: hypothetical protein [unclassified Pseudomonas]|uniref:hypothetical protein n=1 Tax=unclassified Pseudomonas TaxID=196821 RepID=UPI002449D1A4|nr:MULTISPECIES: hypothetical protein [unclassified Pseudomonas]MDG9927445.1 hypothetical protein [Pseudomonas sp. GD04042]MDH0482514.1 hypothetical protein [Pseudomonas sp. GD04015]MDH0602866.1 hypothetical protein [Pseudomonas sp. GD03869]
MTFDALKQQVRYALDQGDEDAREQYTEHAVDNFDADHRRDLAAAIIAGDTSAEALALEKIAGRIKQQEDEFVEFEAARRMRLIEAHDDYMADLNALYRGAA